MNFFFHNLGPIGTTAFIFTAAVLLGVVLHFILFLILKRLAESTSTALDNLLLGKIRGSLLLMLPLLSVSLSVSLFRDVIPEGARSIVHTLVRFLLVISIAWVFIGLINYFQDSLLRRYQLEVKDNLQARRMHTQISIMKKVGTVLIVLLAFVAILMQFETLRSIGTGILASAGLAGVIFGFAAQKSIGNLLAGIQLAFTQPIRTDDVVVVEGEWGRIEEITLTYVVVKIWDQRRLILPISYFIEKPFQNWTRESSDILATAYVIVDYATPINAIRDRLEKIVKKSQNWDGKVCKLQVTDATDKALQLRALMSASSSGAAWDLRCEVREKLNEFLMKNYPECLPRLRTSIHPADMNIWK
jgi:small-conductance mechanosensitive channel